jgi:hypothetical protein
VRKPDPRKANDTHVGIRELEDTLRQEDQSYSKSDEQNTGRTLHSAEKEPKD